MINNEDDKTLLNAFEIERKKTKDENIKDYDVFPDKVLLDKLRSSIIENIIDKEVPVGLSLESFINDQIDASIEGYDLTNLERSHIFNMIEDEIRNSKTNAEFAAQSVSNQYFSSNVRR